tara:strand:+ start:5080 stop:5475 length:396 start_codon:yes stop_codon:yes gene_type:complete
MKNFNYVINLFAQFSKGNKSLFRFIIFGIINSCFSNILLYILLNLLNVRTATLISQTFHASSAYFLGEKKIFKRKGNPFKFFMLILLSWQLQWHLLNFFLYIGSTKSISIILIIPIIAYTSYLFQLKFVYK